MTGIDDGAGGLDRLGFPSFVVVWYANGSGLAACLSCSSQHAIRDATTSLLSRRGRLPDEFFLIASDEAGAFQGRLAELQCAGACTSFVLNAAMLRSVSFWSTSELQPEKYLPKAIAR
jgi:hypothetical protein